MGPHVKPTALLDLPLTGERSYVHGADIFDAVLAATRASADIVVTLRLATATAIALVEHEAAGPDELDVIGTVRCSVGAERQRWLLRRLLDRPAPRLPFDEQALTAGATYGPERLSVPAGPGTFVRRAVAGCMVMAEERFPEDYWSIAEIACAVPPPPEAAVDVVVSTHVGGRYLKAEMAPPGAARIGTIIFARGQPRR